MVAECGALGKAGGAAGELDVYWIVELQLVSECGEAIALGITAEMGDIFEPNRAVSWIGANGDDQPQIREP